MFLSFILLLLAAVSCIDCQIVLTQSEQPVVVSPGGSYKLTCACMTKTASVYPITVYCANGDATVWTPNDDYFIC
ncbi:hypothetical protein Q8A67_000801 [Cirrhinus molitorella]|uniref:Uncharacterized protein n=1 Tax=Cirrhinus molitorella TaxID=172907 RepID=A0AA88QDC4_9TELE|nr:hypothetical protein Q8A67_000801 [Cirrhinus molitorella]